MNIFPAERVDGSLRAGPFLFEARPNLPERVEVGVRPEHVQVDEGDEGAPAEVQVVEMAGNETYLHLQAGDSPIVARVGADAPSGGGLDRARSRERGRCLPVRRRDRGNAHADAPRPRAP